MTTDEKLALSGIALIFAMLLTSASCFTLDFAFVPRDRGNTPWAVAVRNGIACTMDADCAATWTTEQPQARTCP